MGDETRKLLKLFGVAVTDFESEAEKLSGRVTQLSAASGRDEVLSLLTDTSEMCRELSQRWLEITQHVFAIQGQFLLAVAQAGARARASEPG